MASGEKLPEASPYPAEPIPDGSKMDMPRAEAEPARNDSNASVLTDLKRKKSIVTWM